MHRIIRIFWLFLPITGFTQIVQPLGQTPARLRWEQINTSHFRIIYPRGMEDDAQRTINAMENAYYDVSKSLGVTPRKIPIVLQNQTTDNNAFVTSEGRRAEFYSTPPQNPNSQGMNNWIDELSLHEFRHVVQQDQTLRGWGKLMYYIFGYSGTSVTQGLTNPWWFFEGDAVGCESALGYGGRGRIPSFDITFRSTLLDNGAFSYNKAACGSFKNAIPNHYVLGYFMTTYVKNHFGDDIWNKILTRAYRKPPVPFSFSRSMKKVTGQNVQQTYRSMTNELKELWGKQIEAIHETAVTYYAHADNKVFTNYKYPQFLADGNIVAQKAGLADGSFLAYKSSIADQSWFVVLSKEGEKKICPSGVLDDNGMMSSSGNKVVWTEYTYDPRWGARNYTVIKTLDVKTKKVKQLTHRTRLHAPCFSPDGNKIAAIDFSSAGKYELQLFDAASGKMLKAFPNPFNHQLMQPRFTRDGLSIVVIESKPGIKSILKINIETGEISTLLGHVSENISSPIDGGQYIFYNSSQSGIDNIYAVDPATGQQYQVTDRKYGASNPCLSVDGSTLSFQDFTPGGYRIASVPFNPDDWKKIKHVDSSNEKVEYFRKFSTEENGNILSHIPDSVYPSSRYKRMRNAIGIYSWGLQPLSNARHMSLGIRSQDMLSTTILEAGFRYDNDEDGFGKYLKFSYLGLYPEFSFIYNDGKRKQILPGETNRMPFDSSIYGRFGYRDEGFGISLPLNLSSGKFIRKLNIGITGTNTDLYGQIKKEGSSKKLASFTIGHLHSVSYTTDFEIQERQSARDVAPRWGGAFSFLFQNTPFRDFYNASQLAITGQSYLPGFSAHDAFKLSGRWQRDLNSNYHFVNSFPFVRGAPNELFNNLGIWSLDYKVPLFYPDRPLLGGILYFQRVKADLFTEIGRGKRFTEINPLGEIKNYTSTGIELTSDVNFMRFLVPFDAGFRYSYVVQRHAGRVDFLLSIPIF